EGQTRRRRRQARAGDREALRSCLEADRWLPSRAAGISKKPRRTGEGAPKSFALERDAKPTAAPALLRQRARPLDAPDARKARARGGRRFHGIGDSFWQGRRSPIRNRAGQSSAAASSP